MSPGTSPLFRRKPFGSRLVLGLCGALLSVGCASNQGAALELAAVQSKDAQKKLRDFEQQWEIRSEVARRELRPQLEEFISTYPDDPGTARARIMLAQIALGERRFGAAQEILAPVMKGLEGSVKDDAQVILAAVDNRRGNYDQALAKLEPLEGKLLSPESREQYARERISAAIAARRWRLVVSAMITWLAEEGANSPAAREWIQSAALNIPPRALSRVLADWSEEEVSASESNARDWLQRVIILQLTDEALRLRDPLLARDLLERSPTWLRTGEFGDELAVLAALAQKEARVSGRAVGIVLGGKTEKERRRSVRVAAGLVAGLELRTTNSEDAEVRLVAAEDNGSLTSALGSLGGLGATIFVAGVDSVGAKEALEFAESQGVPTILMNDPLTEKALKYAFVLGSSERAEQLAFEQARTKADKWAFVGVDEFSCEISPSLPGVSRLPLFEWRDSGVDGLAVLGDAGCARRIWGQLSALGWRPAFAVGLEGAEGPFPAAPNLFGLGAGQYPHARKQRSDRVTPEEKQSLAGESAKQTLASDWYFLLGYDAAQLVRASLQTLPATQVTEKEEVKARHDQARKALMSASGALKTTAATGFAEHQRISRELLVFDLSTGAVVSPETATSLGAATSSGAAASQEVATP